MTERWMFMLKAYIKYFLFVTLKLGLIKEIVFEFIFPPPYILSWSEWVYIDIYILILLQKVLVIYFLIYMQ